MILKLETNIPQQIALAYDTGKVVESQYGDQIMYTLASPAEHILYVPPHVDTKIHELGISRGEVFEICKREVTRGRRKQVEWQVRRLADDLFSGDETGLPATELESEIEESIHIARRGQGSWPERRAQAGALDAAAAAPSKGSNAKQNGAGDGRLLAPRAATGGHDQPPNNGHGTTRAAAGGQPPQKIPPQKIPMDQAALLAVRMMQKAMKESGEQWSDGARQDYTATLFIGMQKEGWLTLPRIEEAA